MKFLAFLSLFTLYLNAAPIAPHLLGEQNFEHYFGPSEPFFFKDKKFGNSIFEERQRYNKYPYNSIEQELYSLKEFIKDLNTAGLCPNAELANSSEYIRYLYRMSALSYLGELFNRMEEASKNMKLGDVCEVSINRLIKKCAPQSKDMKLFVKSSTVLSRSFSPYMPPYNFDFQTYLKNWMKSAPKKENDPVVNRLRLACSGGKCFSSKAKVEKLFAKSCKQDQKLFERICSEKDDLYGVSYVEQLFHVISSGDVMKVLNDNGNARGCLARYTSVMKDRESYEPIFDKVFPYIFEDLKKRQAAVGGELFPAGSLRVFVKEGLDEIFVEKKPKESKVSKVEPEETIELGPLAPAPLKKVLKPKKKKRKKVVVKKKPRPKKIEKSHFLISAEALKEFNMDSVKLDMLKFKYDYLFNTKMLSYLEEQMPKFFERDGLEEMKKFDSLGSEKGPVPLLFIKYLVANQKHQGLFNLIDVVGSEFYVKNNIDDESVANKRDMVRLEYVEGDEVPHWQISIIKE
ncbi:MAG: hypothetical protein CME64_00575 [Halobacteriovoraceae bacterium]|nr:hypothetical protein [Halobacteriovoraceae bacterium]|tara:strand:- start:132799 stop:134346 length:1548 start_codon:yes stop_codon:yes gene_type:complete